METKNLTNISIVKIEDGFKIAEEALTKHYGFLPLFAMKALKIKEGILLVAMVNIKTGIDVFNYHPLRRGLQLVYTLPPTIDQSKQTNDSLASLQRLYA